MLLCAGVLGLFSGCATVPPRSEAAGADVEITNREPEGACTALGAVEARGGEDDEARPGTAWQALRTHAACRGANYVVIDAFRAGLDSDVIWARLYACALGRSVATAR